MRKRRKKQVAKNLPCAPDVKCHAGSATAMKGNSHFIFTLGRKKEAPRPETKLKVPEPKEKPEEKEAPEPEEEEDPEPEEVSRAAGESLEPPASLLSRREEPEEEAPELEEEEVLEEEVEVKKSSMITQRQIKRQLFSNCNMQMIFLA